MGRPSRCTYNRTGVAVGEDAVVCEGCEAVGAQAVRVVGVCDTVDGDAAVGVTISRAGAHDVVFCRRDGRGRDCTAAGDAFGGRVVR